jgi:hypothetical protein
MISKPKLPSASCNHEHACCAIALPRITENTVLDSLIVAATSPRASGQVGSECIVGGRVFGAFVAGCQSLCMVVIGFTAARVGARMKRRGVITMSVWNMSQQAKTYSCSVVVSRMGVAEETSGRPTPIRRVATTSHCIGLWASADIACEGCAV